MDLVTQIQSAISRHNKQPQTTRRLSDLAGIFSDETAFESILSQGNPVVYTVATIDDYNGDGDLHLGLGKLYPGRVGQEFYMTKGHVHTRRNAAEIYLGLSGSGLMLLQDENTGQSWQETLDAGSIVYVPGHTAHRTINVGDDVLCYVAVYPADAGHDYAAIAQNNFNQVVVADENNVAATMNRLDFLRTTQHE